MGVKTWRFFHPNDGTVPYQDNDPERNRPLYERISDLEDQNARQATRIEDLNHQLQRYQGRVFAGDRQVFRRETEVPRNFTDNRHFIAAEINNFAMDVGRQLVTSDTIEQEVYQNYQDGVMLRLTYRNN